MHGQAGSERVETVRSTPRAFQRHLHPTAPSEHRQEGDPSSLTCSRRWDTAGRRELLLENHQLPQVRPGNIHSFSNKAPEVILQALGFPSTPNTHCGSWVNAHCSSNPSSGQAGLLWTSPCAPHPFLLTPGWQKGQFSQILTHL